MRALPGSYRPSSALADPPVFECPHDAQVAHPAPLAPVDVDVGVLAAQQRATAHVADRVVQRGTYVSGAHGFRG